jgi:hypothetical protein
MDLTGLPFLLVLIAAAATLVAVTMLVWNRWSRWWAYPMRVVCVCYPSWSPARYWRPPW